MADATTLRSGLGLFIQDLLSERVNDNLSDQMPILAMLLGFEGRRNPKSVNKLGVPKSGVLLSGLDLTKAQRQQILTQRTYSPLITIGRPAEGDGKTIGQRDTGSVRSDWTNQTTMKYFKRPIVKWWEREDPMKVANKDLAAVGGMGGSPDRARENAFGLWAAEVESVKRVHLEYLNKKLWGLTDLDAPSDVDAECWDTIYSFANALGYNNSYCGIDRTVSGNEAWKGGTFDDSSSILGTSLVTILDHMNFVDVQTDVKGAAHGGKPIELVVTGPAIFQKWLAEARAIGGQVIYNGEIPNFPKIGFKQPVIMYNQAYAICDWACPAEVVMGINPDTWTVAINPQKNFATSEPYDESRAEGGDKAHTAHVGTEMMIVCESPSNNRYYTSIN